MTPVNVCLGCGWRGAMNQGIRLNWCESVLEWTCIGCVAWAQEILFANAQQFNLQEFRSVPYRYYYYVPA